MQAAFEAALTGHLVLSTIHASDTMEAVNRIVNFFPEGVRDSARTDLSKTLSTIVAQRLVKKLDGGRMLALEVLKNIPAISNNIKRNNMNEISNAMETGERLGLYTLDSSLLKLCLSKVIGVREALINSKDFEWMKKKIGLTDQQARMAIEGDGIDLDVLMQQGNANSTQKKKGLFG